MYVWAAVPSPSARPPPLATDEDGERLTPDMFSKRQLARMGLGDPDKVKHFLPALSRKEKGSFADDYVAEAFEMEVRCPASPAHCCQAAAQLCAHSVGKLARVYRGWQEATSGGANKERRPRAGSTAAACGFGAAWGPSCPQGS